MTRKLQNLTLIVVATLALSCAGKKEAHEGEHKEWKEMDDFHMVMAETFHPYKDSANLEPTKTRAAELATAAEKWTKAPLPEKVNNDEMKEKLEELKNESATLVQTVNEGDDTAIGNQLTRVHDLFHAIQEAWYGGGDSGHKH